MIKTSFMQVHFTFFVYLPSTMKLYAVCDGPPSLACRMTLKHLKVPFELVEVNFNEGEHLTADYAKVSASSKSLIN